MLEKSQTKAPSHLTGIVLIQVVYLFVVSAISIVKGVFPNPETLFLLLVVGFVWKAKTRGLLLDILPVILLLWSYDALRSWADNLTPFNVHITEMMVVDKAIFGVVPAVWLQHNLLTGAWAKPLYYLANGFYISHFTTPILLAVLIWLRYKERFYKPYVLGFLALTYAGFITYFLYPAAPPWLATYWGYLPNGAVSLGSSISFYIMMKGPNPVAAMPSLHGAYPVFVSLFTNWIWGRKTWWIWILPAGVWFSTMLLGHHYFVDLLAGGIYAAVAFAVTVYFTRRAWKRQSVHPDALAASAMEVEAVADR